MPEPSGRDHRAVRSDDPSLSSEANQRLTEELREIIGADAVDVPRGRPDPSHARHARHTPIASELIADRLGYAAAALVLIVVLAIVGLATGSVIALIAAFAVLLIAITLALWLVLGLTAEREHPSPELAALLEEEGVGDPDRLLTDLVDEFRADGGPTS
jgi:hypothetical protein